MMNEYTRRAAIFCGIIFAVFILVFISITFFVAADTRNDLTAHLKSVAPVIEEEEPVLPLALVDNPTYEDIIALASTGGKIDYLSIFFSGDNATYNLTVKYESEDNTTKEIGCDRQESLKKLYESLQNVLRFWEGMKKE